MIIFVIIFGTITANAISLNNDDIECDSQDAESTEIIQKKKKCLLHHIHDEQCGGKYIVDHTKVYPGMNKKLRRHLYKGHHKFHRDVCRRCHLTKKEIRRMEPEVRRMVAEMRLKKHKHRKSHHPGRDEKNVVA